MSTLSNVAPQRGDQKPPSDGFTSLTPFQVSNEGVSVRYAPSPGKKWYVMRATYHREKKAYDYLVAKNDGAIPYIPFRKRFRMVNGRRRMIIESLLPSFLFLYATPEEIEPYLKKTSDIPFLNPYYNHFCADEEGKNPPLTVPYADMMNFIRVTNVESQHIMLVTKEQCHFKSGDRVKIIDGDFVGVEGRVARVAGQQRVVVEVEGVCLVTTAYVPSAFIKVLK